MATAKVRRSRKSWVVDVSEYVDGERERVIKAFGRGSKGKEAAEAYLQEIAPDLKSGKYWERQTATFKTLWKKFEKHELVGSTRAPSTIADYKAMGRLHLLPRGSA